MQCSLASSLVSSSGVLPLSHSISSSPTSAAAFPLPYMPHHPWPVSTLQHRPTVLLLSILSLARVPVGVDTPVAAVTPLVLHEFRRELVGFPARKLNYVIRGIQDGFRVGWEPSRAPLRSRSSNMRSASEHPEVVDKYLDSEVAAHRMAGPLDTSAFNRLHISPFGVIPKQHQPGKWRLILDLSSPHGHSVNDGIPKDPYSLRYITVDYAIRSLVSLGPGALMAKFDVQAAYRNVPIHPDDRFLLGMKWRDKLYVDLVLPFGLRSAPIIFDSVAEAVEWILKHNYAVDPLFHYLDDFLTLGPPNSPLCQSHVDTAFSVFSPPGSSPASSEMRGSYYCYDFPRQS